MKRSISFLVCFIFITNLFSQSKVTDPGPKVMVFIPQGSFDMEMTINSETKTRHISVDAFWMSNEITNGEYREFVDWARNNPDKTLNQIKFSVTKFSDPKNGSVKDTVIAVNIPIKVSSFNSEMIDSLILEKVNSNYKGYFADKKYDDFPVVGVSFKMAEYYCIWKTTKENELLKLKGLPYIQAYRIPLETEWEYVAHQPVIKREKYGLSGVIQKVNEGDENDWGLNHFRNNVSELVTANRGGAIIRGGSWKSEGMISARQQIDKDSREASVGFRIVRSYISGEK
jgi:formylglycine-generating enzyme required for sulfatase activity